MRALPTSPEVAGVTYDVHALGHEAQPLVVIDNIVDDPEALIALAEAGPPFVAQPTDYYPGIRKPISNTYSDILLQKVEPVLRDVFGLEHQYQPQVRLSAFSLTTTQPQNLRPIQCSLHSGDISSAVGLSSDPRVGRLTLNSFIESNPA